MASSKARPDTEDAWEAAAAPYDVTSASMLGTVATQLGSDLKRVTEGHAPVMVSAVGLGALQRAWSRLPETWAGLSAGTVDALVVTMDALAAPDFARAGVDAVTVAESPYMSAAADTGRDAMATALSETTAWGNVRLRRADGRVVHISQWYREQVGDAARMVAEDGATVHEVTQAITDRLVGERNGLRIVRTISDGRDRSYDITGAVRQDVWDNRARVMGEIRGEQGRICGMDAVEVTAHSTCAPDHIDAQGKIYTLAEFDRLQNTLPRPIGMWNCRHLTWPCWSDSTPSRTPAELREMSEMSERVVSFRDENGRERAMSAYEFTQWQRSMERRVRDSKVRGMVYEAAGDTAGARETAIVTRQLRREYNRASASVGIRTMPDRMLVGTLA